MSNKIQLQRKREAIARDLSRRNFQIATTHLRCALNWKIGHLASSAMLTYFRLENLVLRLLAWRKPCEPPLENQLEKIDNQLHEHWDDDEDENQNTQNSCVRSVSTGAHKLNPNAELTGASGAFAAKRPR